MSDPRLVNHEQRAKKGPSPLIQALRAREQGANVNFCPFGCQDHELDVNGYCGHLIGFKNNGSLYEPRIRDATGRIITSGEHKRPMRPGYRMVPISTSARVYCETPDEDLIVERFDGDDEQREMAKREQEIIDQADRMRNPPLEGDWMEPTAYGPVAAAATDGVKRKKKELLSE